MSATGLPRRDQSTVLAVALLVAAVAWSLATAARYRNVGSDFVQDYLSAQVIGTGVSIYKPLPEDRAVPPSEKSGTRREVVNDHPPPYVLALAPLGAFPYPVAFMLLAVANIVALVGVCFVVARELGWSWQTGALLAAGLLVHPGTSTCLSVGNISLVLFGVIALGWRSFRQGQSLWAGVWLGLATAIKLYPGLLVLGLLVNRSWRATAIAGCVVGVCWGGSALAVGLDDVMTYVRDRAPANARAYVTHGFNLSVTGAAHRSFGLPNPESPWLDRVTVNPELAAGLAWVGRVLVGLLVVVGVIRATAAANYPDRAFAVLIPGMLLLSPLTWLHAVPMMLIPVAVLLRESPLVRRAALAACGAAMCVYDHWLVTKWIELTDTAVPWPANLVLLAPTWGMIGVLVLAVLRPRRGATSPSSQPV